MTTMTMTTITARRKGKIVVVKLLEYVELNPRECQRCVGMTPSVMEAVNKTSSIYLQRHPSLVTRAMALLSSWYR